MAFVRIVVHGNGLLDLWAAAAPGKSRHSEAARVALCDWLASYSDASDNPVTLIFEGAEAGSETAFLYADNPVQILFTHGRQHTNQLLQRLGTRWKHTGEVLAVIDDKASEELVRAWGGQVCTCAEFKATVDAALGEFQSRLQDYNQSEQLKFKCQL